MLKILNFKVGPVDISAINRGSFLNSMEEALATSHGRSAGYVIFRDVHGLVKAMDDKELAEAHRRALVVAPDGMPFVMLAHMLGYKGVSRVCGPDMLPAVCEHGLGRGWRHVFFGSTPETLKLLEKRLRDDYPQIEIADMIAPPFRPLSDEESDQMIARINAAKPDFVWVGLGSPKQDIWMLKFAERIPDAVCMGVGAAFDMSAGTVQRAPKWMRRSSFEWIYRLIQEPKRLARRYLTAIPRFFPLLIREALHGRLGKASYRPVDPRELPLQNRSGGAPAFEETRRQAG